MIWRWGAAALRLLPPETAHRATLRAMRAGIHPRRPADPFPELAIRVFGLDFPNPIGLAAGFDKDAAAPDAALAAGFGFVEVGTVTPLPQAGNPRPRLFRLPDDPAEATGLQLAEPGQARRLEAELGSRLSRLPRQPGPRPEAAEELRALGYIQ